MSDGVAVIRARLKLPDTETFIRTFAPRINAGGMLVRTKQLKPVGSRVRFEFSLENGERMLLGEGIVRKVRSGDQPGMTIRFTKLNRASKELVDRIVAFRREQQGEAADSLESFSDMDLSDAPDLPPTAAHDHTPIPGQLPSHSAHSARLGAASPALSPLGAASPALPSPSAALQALRAAQQAPKPAAAPQPAAPRPFVEPPKMECSPLARAAAPQVLQPLDPEPDDPPSGGAVPFHTDSRPSMGAVLQSSRVLTTLRDSGQIPAAAPEPIPLADALDRLEHEEDGAAVFDPRQSHAFGGLDLDEAEVDDVLGNLFGSADSHAPQDDPPFFMGAPPAPEEEPAWGVQRLGRGDELVPTPAVPEVALPLAQMVADPVHPAEETPSAVYDSHFDPARAMASVDEGHAPRATPDQPWDPFAALSARRVHRDPEPPDEALDDPFASPAPDSFDRLLENPSAFGEGPSVFGEAPSVYPELQGAALADDPEPHPQPYSDGHDPAPYEPQPELDLGAPEPAFHSGASPLASDAFEDDDSDEDAYAEGGPLDDHAAPQAHDALASEEHPEEEPLAFFGDHAAHALHRREEAQASVPARSQEEFDVDLEDFDLPPLAEPAREPEPSREQEFGPSASQGLQALGRIKLARRSSAALPVVEEPEPTEMLSLEDLAALKGEAFVPTDALRQDLPASPPQDQDPDDDFFEAEVFKAPPPREEGFAKAELPRFSNLVQPSQEDGDDLSVDVPLDDEPLAALSKREPPKPVPEIELFAPPSVDEDSGEDDEDDEARARPLAAASITPLTDFKTLASRGPTLSAMPKIEIRGDQGEPAAVRPSAALKPAEPARATSELFGLLDELQGRPSAALPSVPFAAPAEPPSKRLTLASQSIPELPTPPKETLGEPDDPSLEGLLGAARRQIQQHHQEEAPPEEVRPPDAILDDVIGEVAPPPRASAVFQAVAPPAPTGAVEAEPQAPKKKGFFSRLFGRD